jgi:hypothetical protein
MTGSVEFVYNHEKSTWLRHNRGMGFEEIIEYIESGWVIGIRQHPNRQKHPDQWVYDIDVEGYVYRVPFYVKGKTHELRTLYPSRTATKEYFGDKDEKEK